MVQSEPFQVSINVSERYEGRSQLPTAVQSLVAVHEIPSREDRKPSTFGDGTIDHVLPFQCSIRVAAVESLSFPALPTASQELSATHVTAESPVTGLAAGSGRAVIVQVEPFQRSTNGFAGADPM